jgi:uncharacterized protein YgiB involved in biofilm formation
MFAENLRFFHMRFKSVSRAAAIAMIFGATTFALTACGGNDQGEVAFYTDLNSCLNANKFEDDRCRAEWQRAIVMHNRLAPSYMDGGDCNKAYGVACQPANVGNLVAFRPPFGGMLLSQNPGPGYGTSAYTNPEFREDDDEVDVDFHYFGSYPVYGGHGTYYSHGGTHIRPGSHGLVTLPRHEVTTKPAVSRPLARGNVSRPSFGNTYRATGAGKSHGGGHTSTRGSSVSGSHGGHGGGK